MTPDEVNRAAILGILGMALVVGLIYMANWALGEDRAPVLVAGVTVPTAAVTDAGTVGEPQTGSTTADEASTATTIAATARDSATDPASPTTTTIPVATTSPATTTTVRATTTTTTRSTATTTTTVFASTTTTTRVPPATTTTTVRPTSTTTVRPTTTTTVRPTTTTTVRPTTTTTLPPTTTTTTTTLPPTTTTTIPLPGLLVHKFDGHDHGDEGEWEAHIKIEIRDENDDRAPFASVRVAWDGSTAGSEVLGSNKDGKIDTRLGLFADASITFRITNVVLSGYTYRPSLNEESANLLIVGPD